VRKAIYEHLKNNSQYISDWYQTFSADADTAKPFGVIRFGAKVRSAENTTGRFRYFSVWPYFDEEEASFIDVDNAEKEIYNLLNDARLQTDAGQYFRVEWEDSGEDFTEDAIKAITRPQYFRIPLVG